MVGRTGLTLGNHSRCQPITLSLVTLLMARCDLVVESFVVIQPQKPQDLLLMPTFSTEPEVLPLPLA